MDKDLLCKAFCDEVGVRRVPIGWAVRTPFENASGDLIGFYVARVSDGQKYRIEDDGTNIAFLEALGVNLRSGNRRSAFDALLEEYGVNYDSKSGQLHTKPIDESQLAQRSLRFMAMLLRLQDFSLMHPTTVANTFREDAKAAIERRFSGIANIRYEEAVGGLYGQFVADAVIEPQGVNSVAVFYGIANHNINEALLLWYEINLHSGDGPRVALLLESLKSRGITERILARAINRLDAVAVFRGSEQDALDKIQACITTNRAVH